MMTTGERSIGRADLFRSRRRRHAEDVVVRADDVEAKAISESVPSSVTELGVDRPDQIVTIDPRPNVG